MRLDKFIANNSEYSRKDVKKMARSNLVMVNEIACKDLSLLVQEADKVTVDGVWIEPIPSLYFMLNKPKDTVCANTDYENPTVIDVLADAAFEMGCSWIVNKPSIVDELQIVGRLDKDTTGLLFLTNDGQWNHRVVSPNAQCEKTYVANLTDEISQEAIDKLEQGVFLKDDHKRTLPARVTLISNHCIELTISEGRYHQVKRMIAAVGNHVNGLHRSIIGSVALDTNLEPGNFRELTPQEIESF